MRGISKAFALPTVMITSVIMLGLLLMSLQLVTASANALKTQYYNQLAREAAESGREYAKQCLTRNNDIAQWSNDTINRTLTPATDCEGVIVPGAASYVMANDKLETTFVVGTPVRADGMQRVPVEGKVALKRTSDGKVYKTYTYNQASQSGASTLVNSVSFGYSLNYPLGVDGSTQRGTFFGAIDEFGSVRTLGFNVFGQLGNGVNFSSHLTPQTFSLPAGKVASKIFTNFQGMGSNLFVLTADGEVYGVGANEYGQLGGGSVADRVNNRIKFKLPSGDNKAAHVAALGWTTFVVTTKGNVYVAGLNLTGAAGTGNTTHPILNPVKVPLPDGELARADEASWALDYRTVYMIARSGNVYAWGQNNFGQLGRGTKTISESSPAKVGIPSSKKAVQVVHDGETAYILTSDGLVYGVGRNTFGQTGTRFTKFQVPVYDNECISVPDNSNILVSTKCSSTENLKTQETWIVNANGTIERTNGTDSLVGSGRCIQYSANPNDVKVASCNP